MRQVPHIEFTLPVPWSEEPARMTVNSLRAVLILVLAGLLSLLLI